MTTTALFGHPVEHSFSPKLFGIYAEDCGLEYTHIKCDIPTGKQNLADAIAAIRFLRLAGVNITLPYKMDAMSLVDSLDQTARVSGAVNTIQRKGSKLIGYNTDSFGAVKAIEGALRRKVSEKDSILIIGTGGAARALIAGLLSRTKEITVVFRKPGSKRTRSLVKDFGKLVTIRSADTDLAGAIAESSIVCNASDCGMSPKKDRTPISKRIMNIAARKSNFRNKLFFDVIFNPEETKFLLLAREAGGRVQGGTDMMIYQGICAFELWTGKRVGPRTVEKAKRILRGATS